MNLSFSEYYKKNCYHEFQCTILRSQSVWKFMIKTYSFLGYYLFNLGYAAQGEKKQAIQLNILLRFLFLVLLFP